MKAKRKLRKSVIDLSLTVITVIALLIVIITIVVFLSGPNKDYATTYDNDFKGIYSERKNDMSNYLNKKSATEAQTHIAQNTQR